MSGKNSLFQWVLFLAALALFVSTVWYERQRVVPADVIQEVRTLQGDVLTEEEITNIVKTEAPYVDDREAIMAKLQKLTEELERLRRQGEER